MFATSIRALAVLVTISAGPTMADPFEDFTAPRENWAYVADTVMGGVSEGSATIRDGAVRLTGVVSTANNGGFVQVRSRFGGGWPSDATGLRMQVRGNGERYYVFLRTEGLARPWFSYRQAFDTSSAWADIELLFAEFTASREQMPARFTPDQVISIGLVAYGRDHVADLSVRQIELF